VTPCRPTHWGWRHQGSTTTFLARVPADHSQVTSACGTVHFGSFCVTLRTNHCNPTRLAAQTINTDRSANRHNPFKLPHSFTELPTEHKFIVLILKTKMIKYKSSRYYVCSHSTPVWALGLDFSLTCGCTRVC